VPRLHCHVRSACRVVSGHCPTETPIEYDSSDQSTPEDQAGMRRGKLPWRVLLSSGGGVCHGSGSFDGRDGAAVANRKPARRRIAWAEDGTAYSKAESEGLLPRACDGAGGSAEAERRLLRFLWVPGSQVSPIWHPEVTAMYPRAGSACLISLTLGRAGGGEASRFEQPPGRAGHDADGVEERETSTRTSGK